jgi:hypothetical protein
MFKELNLFTIISNILIICFHSCNCLNIIYFMNIFEYKLRICNIYAHNMRLNNLLICVKIMLEEIDLIIQYLVHIGDIKIIKFYYVY